MIKCFKHLSFHILAYREYISSYYIPSGGLHSYTSLPCSSTPWLPPPPLLPLSLIHTTRKRKTVATESHPSSNSPSTKRSSFLPSFHIFLLRPPFTLPALFLSRCMHLCISCPRRHDMQPRNRGTSVYAREKVDENSRASQQPFVAGSRLFERYFRRRGVFALHPVQINGANSI